MSKLRIRHGDNEIEVEGNDAFVKKQLADFYQKVAGQTSLPSSASLKQGILEPIKKRQPTQFMTPAEFYKDKAKGKTDGVSQILIFGKYLEEYEGKSEFSRQEINGLANKAKLSKDIHAQYFTNGVKQGLLRSHGRSKYSLTLSAESVIASM